MGEFDWFERCFFGFVLLVVYFLTEVVIFLAALATTCFVLGFIAEKLIDRILDED